MVDLVTLPHPCIVVLSVPRTKQRLILKIQWDSVLLDSGSAVEIGWCRIYQNDEQIVQVVGENASVVLSTTPVHVIFT